MIVCNALGDMNAACRLLLCRGSRSCLTATALELLGKGGHGRLRRPILLSS